MKLSNSRDLYIKLEFKKISPISISSISSENPLNIGNLSSSWWQIQVVLNPNTLIAQKHEFYH